MSDGQPQNLRFEEEKQPQGVQIAFDLVPPQTLNEPGGVVESELPPTAVMEARVAVARMVQAGPIQGAGFLAACWFLASPALFFGALVTLSQNPEVSAFLFLFFATGLKLGKLSAQNEQMRTALTLRNVTNAWIGPLAEILEWPGTRTQRVAMYLLSHLLPSVTTSDWKNLTDDQRRILYSRLDPKYTRHESDLQIALMRGLEKMGETDAIPYVERLENIVIWNAKRRRVRYEARMCQRTLEVWEQKEAAQLSQVALVEEGIPITSVAEQVVVEKVPPELEALITELRQAREKSAQPGMRLPYLFASWCIIVPFTTLECYLSLTEGSKWMALLWAFLTVVGSQLHRLTLLPWQTAHVKRLAEYDSVKGIGYLAEVMEWPDASAQSAAGSALIRLLPRLKASDSHLLNPKQRLCLYRKLTLANVRREYDLIQAILKAMEQVGDVSAVGYVQKLAQAKPLTAAQRRVVQSAQECLPYLLKRAEANEGSQYLLRAAYSVETAPETLLRPASEKDVPQEDLLHPLNVMHLEDE